MRLSGKTILVTGAARGIGLAMTDAFLKAGARVIMSDIEDARLKQSFDALGAGDRAMAVRLDVTDLSSISAASEAISRSGFDINVLVNNAATISIGNILDTTSEDLRKVLGVNVEGTFNVTKAFLPGMITRGGGVVLNMASLAAVRALHERFAYGASKAAIAMMTRSIAVDFVKKNIRANCICPARVHTEFVEDYVTKYFPGEEESVMKRLSAYQPIGRMIQPSEVADMAVYLCSEESAMVTGSAFVIDGGVMAGD
jgi:NAD(P)-dependent dehydrogenase (short-subunit alcohol dehydrogenase family)